MHSFLLKPLRKEHIEPFRRPEEDSIYFDRLHKGVQAFYAGDFREAETLLTLCRDQQPDDVRAAFFDALIPFLEYYFLEENDGTAHNTFEQKLRSFPVHQAHSGSNLALLMTSGLYGYASMAALKASNYMDAARRGLEGWNYLRKIDGADDTGFSLIGRGLTSFLAGSAPFPVRLSFVAQGVHANKEEGIRLLRKAAESDSIVSTDAVLILTQLYPLLEEHGIARHLANELCRVYPENKIYRSVLEKLV